jgi:cell division protein FtsB
MHSDGSDITIASTGVRAGVHRSFIHRHADVHAAVLTAAAEAIENPSPAATTISHRSVLTENANLHALNRRLAQRVRDLEDRLSEMLGQQAFERSGLGAPAATAALQDELEHQKQLVLDLTGRVEELDEELAAAREANRGLMAELNRT